MKILPDARPKHLSRGMAVLLIVFAAGCAGSAEMAAVPPTRNADASECSNSSVPSHLRSLPPEGLVPPGGQPASIALEMFDTGPASIGTFPIGEQRVPILSGDAIAEDQVFTREFYFNTTSSPDVMGCVVKNDFAQAAIRSAPIVRPSRSCLP